MNGEAPCLPVDEDAFSPPRLAQEKREGMGGESGAPAERHPGEPERARGEPEIDRGADEDAGDEGREVDEKDSYRQVFEHAVEHAVAFAVLRAQSRASRALTREHDGEPAGSTAVREQTPHVLPIGAALPNVL